MSVDRIVHPLRRLRRWLFCRGGHGVHSPFAFSFITEVVTPRYPYYYRGCRAEHPHRKTGELLYRLIERMHYRQILYLGKDPSFLSPYLKAPHEKIDIHHRLHPEVCYDLIVAEETRYLHELLPAHPGRIPCLATEGAVVALHIDYPEDYAWWKQIQQNPSIALSFDLLTIGLLFPNKPIRKHHYNLYF